MSVFLPVSKSKEDSKCYSEKALLTCTIQRIEGLAEKLPEAKRTNGVLLTKE